MNELAFADIQVGDTATMSRTITEEDILDFAEVTGDHNPVHVNPEFAAGSLFGRQIAHGMLVASQLSALMAEQLPGPNSLYLGQTLEFRAPVFIGDTITARVEVLEKNDKKRALTIETVVTNQAGKDVITGVAVAKKVGL